MQMIKNSLYLLYTLFIQNVANEELYDMNYKELNV